MIPDPHPMQSGAGCDLRLRNRAHARPDIVPILRSGIPAREFCRGGAHAEVAAVFERSIYLRSGNIFVCIGEPAIGNGPLTLIADLDAARPIASLGLFPGQPASISNRTIAIGNAVKLTLDRCVLWHQPHWPASRSLRELNDLSSTIAHRMTLKAPRESLARVYCQHEGSAESPLTRISRPRIARFQSWLVGSLPRSTAFSGEVSSALAANSACSLPPCEAGQSHVRHGRACPGHPRLVCSKKDVDARHKAGHDEPLAMAVPCGAGLPSAAPVADLIGLGPGLTPSGDDFLVGALALLDALEERRARAALARAITDLPPGSTSALSECLLRTAAAGHFGEHLYRAVSALVSGRPDQSVAAIRKIGHSSGWDMMAGILTTLHAVTTAPRTSPGAPD